MLRRLLYVARWQERKAYRSGPLPFTLPGEDGFDAISDQLQRRREARGKCTRIERALWDIEQLEAYGVDTITIYGRNFDVCSAVEIMCLYEFPPVDIVVPPTLSERELYAAALPYAEVVRRLDALISRPALAFAAQADPQTVQYWIDGETAPWPSCEAELRRILMHALPED